MDEATQTVIDYLFYSEEKSFHEYMSEQKGRNPQGHIFYSVLVMMYKGDDKAIRTWLRENCEQEETGTTVEDLSYLIQDKITEAQDEYLESEGYTTSFTIPCIYANAKKMRTYLQVAESFLCRNNRNYNVSLSYDSNKYEIKFTLSDKEDTDENEDEDNELENQWYIGSLDNDEEIIYWSTYEAAGSNILKKKPKIAPRISQ
jgi:hypothetical protein